MADIIRLNDDPHAQTQHLLPWYVTGALDGQELAQVEQHLSQCAECREDAEIEKALAHQVRSLPCDVERGWATLKARIDGAPAARRKASLFNRRIPIGWAVAAQAAILAIVVPIMTFAPIRGALTYRTLGSAPVAAGNLIVVFRPDAPEAAMRAILTQNQARIVDGPTSTGGYVLHVDPERHATVLARLKSEPNVSLAEPLDGADR
jgi:anti-sigma factor RsiW